MYLPSTTVARAVDVLRSKPLNALEFHDLMWSDRKSRAHASKARAAHAVLRPLVSAGLLVRYGNGSPSSDTFVATGAPVTAVPLPVASGETPAVGPGKGPAVVFRSEPEFDWRSGPGSQPVPGVVHDQAFGNVLLGGIPVTDELIDHVLLERVQSCHCPELASDIINGVECCAFCDAPLVRQIRAYTIDFVLDGYYQAPRGFVLRVTPEQAARVVWLRRARREWTKQIA